MINLISLGSKIVRYRKIRSVRYLTISNEIERGHLKTIDLYRLIMRGVLRRYLYICLANYQGFELLKAGQNLLIKFRSQPRSAWSQATYLGSYKSKILREQALRVIKPHARNIRTQCIYTDLHIFFQVVTTSSFGNFRNSSNIFHPLAAENNKYSFSG